jgi:hypothetical protein
MGGHQKILVHADDVGPHAAACVTEYMGHNSLKRAPHPPDSPDFAPSDFCLFGYIKHYLQGYEFTKRTEHVSAILDILNQIPTDTLVDVCVDWMRRL